MPANKPKVKTQYTWNEKIPGEDWKQVKKDLMKDPRRKFWHYWFRFTDRIFRRNQ